AAQSRKGPQSTLLIRLRILTGRIVKHHEKIWLRRSLAIKAVFVLIALWPVQEINLLLKSLIISHTFRDDVPNCALGIDDNRRAAIEITRVFRSLDARPPQLCHFRYNIENNLPAWSNAT